MLCIVRAELLRAANLCSIDLSKAFDKVNYFGLCLNYLLFLKSGSQAVLPVLDGMEHTIRYDSVYLTCSKKLTGSQLSLPHGQKCLTSALV